MPVLINSHLSVRIFGNNKAITILFSRKSETEIEPERRRSVYYIPLANLSLDSKSRATVFSGFHARACVHT